jgi:DNA-binding transcriptional LysR family regulator
MFKDPLLVKGPGGMSLTARAMEIYQPLQQILNDVSRIVVTPTMEPSEMRGEVVIATRDYEMAVALPDVIKRVIEPARELTMRIVPMVGDDLSALDRNEVDFVVAGSERTSATLRRKTLFKDSFVGVLSSDHPAARHKLTMEKYLSMRHCLISFSDLRPGMIDTTLAKLGHERQAIVHVPHFLAAAHLVSSSDLIVTLPRRLGLQLALQGGLTTRELPFKIPEFPIYLYWHIRNENNPMHSWLRQMFMATS